MSLQHQFYALLAGVFLLVLTFTLWVSNQASRFSAEGTRLMDNLRRTAQLNQELASGNAEQADQLRQQIEQPEASFLERARMLDYGLGEKTAEYLKLDIGGDERLVVERIRVLQAELGLLAMHIHERLRSGERRRAAAEILRFERLHSQVRGELDRLSGLQRAKLEAVLAHFGRSVRASNLAAGTLILILLLAGGIGAVVLHTRVLRPIQALLRASDRVSAGDFSTRVQADRPDELGRLAHAFNYMTESLARSYADLEQKVEERTNALQDAYSRLRQAEKLSALGQLVGGVAHELNNPLAAILGFAELSKIEHQMGADRGPAITRCDDIIAQVERCRKIVTNLLQFARQQEPHVEPVELNALVEQVLQLRKYDLQTKNIRIVRHFDPSSPVVIADGDKLQQVVLNLLNNAHDAVTEAGRAGTIWVRTKADGDRVTLEFLDDGPGFKDPERAFEPFYTTKEVGKGTGLGLSVCYGIVREHQGEITAENWLKGARVTVTLPMGRREGGRPAAVEQREPSTVPAVQPTGDPAGPGGLRALVVDDEDALARMQVAFLSRMGISAAAVPTGEAGIRYLERHEVDAVISDVRMPGSVDGVQLYRWVQRNRPALADRFVFASGDIVGLNLDEVFAEIPVRRIQKPFRFDVYRQVVSEVVRRPRDRSLEAARAS